MGYFEYSAQISVSSGISDFAISFGSKKAIRHGPATGLTSSIEAMHVSITALGVRS